MKQLLFCIKGIVYRAFAQAWITSSAGEPCNPVPVYYVKEYGSIAVHRSVRIVEKEAEK
jgi:hypothetical protein